jgi:3-methyladenine DNA glycosylase AlkD
MMDYDEIIAVFEKNKNFNAVLGMARAGITAQKIYGLSIPFLRGLAKQIGKNHRLALRLWENNTRETRILASMIDNPSEVTDRQLEEWVYEFDSWEVCDQCCMCLIEKTPFAWDKAVEWSARTEEFVKRAGFVLMARLAVSDKKAMDERFERFFSIMLREASDNRNFVKKAVNWALRQIGKRNSQLHERAIVCARSMMTLESKSARWIATDTLRELESDAVKKALNSKSKR